MTIYDGALDKHLNYKVLQKPRPPTKQNSQKAPVGAGVLGVLFPLFTFNTFYIVHSVGTLTFVV